MEATAFPPFQLKKILKAVPCQGARLVDGIWNEDRLMALMEPLKDFVVVDVASEEYLGHIVHQLDTVRDTISGCCSTAIHFACSGVETDANGRLSLLKGLLQLGADPDVLDSHGVTISEYCSKNALRASADVIRKCRPDLSLVSVVTTTSQLQYAISCAATTRKNHAGVAEVANVWRKVKSQGFPSLAHLAHDQEWWAVHNLCRRKVVPDAEVNLSYKGKTAVQWARFHGQRLAMAELLYLLKPNLDKTTPDSTRQPSDPEVEETKEMFLLAVAEINQEREKLKNEIASLTSENMTLKKEGAEQEAKLAAQAAEVSTLKEKVQSAIAGLRK